MHNSRQNYMCLKPFPIFDQSNCSIVPISESHALNRYTMTKGSNSGK